MPLDEYLVRQKISISKFALKCGLSRQSLHAYLNGSTLPNGPNARKIIKASDYQVTLDELWHCIDYKEEVDDVL